MVESERSRGTGQTDSVECSVLRRRRRTAGEPRTADGPASGSSAERPPAQVQVDRCVRANPRFLGPSPGPRRPKANWCRSDSLQKEIPFRFSPSVPVHQPQPSFYNHGRPPIHRPKGSCLRLCRQVLLDRPRCPTRPRVGCSSCRPGSQVDRSSSSPSLFFPAALASAALHRTSTFGICCRRGADQGC